MSKKFLSGINVTGTATLNSVANAGGNTNKFLVLESDGSVKYRTSSETAGDIGAVPTGRQLTINGVTYDLSQNRAWTISTGSILNSRTVTEFTATAGQTTFNLTYNPNGLEVFYNGSNLDSTEYTATNGTSIVLTNACNVGDVVKVISLIDGVTVSGVTPISFNSANGQISIQQASDSQAGYLSSTDWTTFNNKVSTSRTLTINGTAYDLSADRSWSIAPGGTAGQILSKNSATDYDWSWIENFAEKIQHSVKLGEAITKGQAVYVAPSGDNNSTNMTVMKASNATEATSSKTMGLVAASGVLNDFVRVITEGLLSGLDTSTANQGDPVWLGTNGNLIFGLANKPVAPAHMVFIGIVTRVNQNNGEIFVKVQNGFELNELHNVLLVSEANNQALVYESSTGLWKNKTLSTSWITEGTNLYYTDARVGSYLTTNSYATQTYVTTQIANLVNSAPTTLDTLNELATALGNDPNFATTIATSLGGKEPTITAGTTTQYWRGDKTWQTLPVYTLSGLGGVPTSRTITINGVAYDLSADRSWSIAAGVTSFNTRTGAITLTSGDVTTALGYTPYNGATNPNGYITGVTNISGYAAMLNTSDTRAIAPSSHNSYRLTFGFTSWGNNSSPDWADYLHLRSYGDSSGGADNLIMFKKSGIGMRIWQQTFGSSTNYSSYVDVLHSGNYSSYAVPTSRTITINGTAYDLSSDRSWNVTASTATSAGYLTGGDSSFYAILYNSNSGDLNGYNTAGLYSSEYIGSTNKPSGFSNGHWIQISDAGGTDVKTQWYYNDNGDKIAMRLQWGSGTWRSWRTLIHDGNYSSYSSFSGNISGNAINVTYDTSSSSGQGRFGGWYNGNGYLGLAAEIGVSGGKGYVLCYNRNTSSYGNFGIEANAITIQSVNNTSIDLISYSNYKINFTGGDQINAYAGASGATLYLNYNNGSGAPVNMAAGKHTFDNSGNVYHSGTLNAVGGLNIGNVVKFRWGGNTTPTLGHDLGGSDTGNSLHIEVSDSDTGGLCIQNDGVTVYGAGDAGFVFRVIDEDSFQGGGGAEANTCFKVLQGAGGGAYVRGTFTATADVVAYSDIRVKENINQITNALSKVMSINGYYYNRTDLKDKSKKIGFIAQEIKEVLPELVTYDKEQDIYAVSYGNTSALLVEAIKELKAENDELRSILKRNNIN